MSVQLLFQKKKTNLSTLVARGGSSSGSPATGYMQHSSPAPSSTPGSDMSGQPAASPGWDVKPQQPIHPPPHPAPHPHPPHNYLPQYSWYPTDNPGLLTQHNLEKLTDGFLFVFDS
ncbi:hypothetical protein GEV33_000970 [Tenebrio molitor]|uniref:Uncharacterized protein n=1 Tax=Tenebrio molitor TaxID=7067 RepID=A0A8J6HTY5_TENMO|nr:hypothetical protein GEV33_000970 [Tenebrio molitor]